MKNRYALILFFIVSNLVAQVDFNLSVKAGGNFSKLINTKSDFITEYNYGVGFDINIHNKYSYINEIGISRKGASNITYAIPPNYNSSYNLKVTNNNSDSFRASYLTYSGISKFYLFDGKANIHIGPSMDFIITKFDKSDNDFDLAMNIGVGIQLFKNLEFEVRCKKGTLPVYRSPYRQDSNDSIMMPLTGNSNNYFVVQSSLVYVFKKKKESEEEKE